MGGILSFPWVKILGCVRCWMERTICMNCVYVCVHCFEKRMLREYCVLVMKRIIKI
jgi:hypothetical protein